MPGSRLQLAALAEERALREKNAELRRKRILDAHRRGLTLNEILVSTGCGRALVKRTIEGEGLAPRASERGRVGGK